MSINPREMFHRSPNNPILTAGDVPEMVSAIFNPGVARVGSTTVLLARVEDRTGISRLIVATNNDGESSWAVEPGRGMAPEKDRPEEHWGIEDPRISKIGDDYYIVYTGESASGPQLVLADHERLRSVGSPWPDRGPRRPRRRPVSRDVRRQVRAAPPADAHRDRRGGHTHLVVLEPGPDGLGRPPTADLGTPSPLVGLKTSRHRAAAVTDSGRVAGLLSNRKHPGCGTCVEARARAA